MKYNRASLEDTVRAAKSLKRQAYVFATYNGFTIATNCPPGNQRYVRIDTEGNMYYHQPTFLVDVVGGL